MMKLKKQLTIRNYFGKTIFRIKISIVIKHIKDEIKKIVLETTGKGTFWEKNGMYHRENQKLFYRVLKSFKE